VDESSWARGQAWGLYGLVTCYRYTGDGEFLNFAENVADYMISHPNLPEDGVPYWDYNVVDPGLEPEWDYDPSRFEEIPRDASAAAITCSALLELSQYSAQKSKRYHDAATTILGSLASPAYLALDGINKYFILNHSVGSIPHGVEIDVPLVYADYYFLEALLRHAKLSSP
jgi:chondroitin AC lyase